MNRESGACKRARSARARSAARGQEARQGGRLIARSAMRGRKPHQEEVYVCEVRS